MIPIALAVKTAAVIAGAAGFGITVAAVASSSGTPDQALTANIAASHHTVITIQHGDTLGDIATRYCGTASAYPSLALANHLANPNKIITGKHLTIVCTGAPPARLQPTATPTATVTITITAPAPTVTVTAPPATKPKSTPTQAIIPASTPSPTPSPTTSPTVHASQPAQRSTPVPRRTSSSITGLSSITGSDYAAGHANIPGTSPQYSIAGMERFWIRAGGNPAHAAVAACIANAVSKGIPDMVGNTGGVGLWQIRNGGAAMADPISNAKQAIAISHNGSNWGPWASHAACHV